MFNQSSTNKKLYNKSDIPISTYIARQQIHVISCQIRKKKWKGFLPKKVGSSTYITVFE